MKYYEAIAIAAENPEEKFAVCSGGFKPVGFPKYFKSPKLTALHTYEVQEVKDKDNGKLEIKSIGMNTFFKDEIGLDWSVITAEEFLKHE